MIFPSHFGNKYEYHSRKFNMAMRLVKLYEPYLLYKGMYVALSHFFKLSLLFLHLFSILNGIYLTIYSCLNSHLEYTLKLYCIKCRFDDINLETLRIKNAAKEMDTRFGFNPKFIDWEDYFMNTHIHGLIKHVLKK